MDLPLIGIALDATPQLAKRVQPLLIAAGETGVIPIVVYHADAATPYNLSGCQLQFVAEDAFDNVLISRQATIDSPGLGTAHFPLLVGDTLGLEGAYRYNIWLNDANFTPNLRFQVVGVDVFTVGEGLGQPNQPVTVPPSQQPLALGPHLASTTTKIGPYAAKFNDLVRVDPTAGSFAVTLPSAATAVDGSDEIEIKNVSDSPNTVSVTLFAGDTIDGLATYFIGAREHLRIRAYGTDWMTT